MIMVLREREEKCMGRTQVGEDFRNGENESLIALDFGGLGCGQTGIAKGAGAKCESGETRYL